MGTLAAIGTALGEGLKLAWALFTARNSPAMQANAKAATVQKIRDAVTQHVATQDTAAIERDIAQ